MQHPGSSDAFESTYVSALFHSGSRAEQSSCALLGCGFCIWTTKEAFCEFVLLAACYAFVATVSGLEGVLEATAFSLWTRCWPRCCFSGTELVGHFARISAIELVGHFRPRLVNRKSCLLGVRLERRLGALQLLKRLLRPPTLETPPSPPSGDLVKAFQLLQSVLTPNSRNVLSSVKESFLRLLRGRPNMRNKSRSILK